MEGGAGEGRASAVAGWWRSSRRSSEGAEALEEEMSKVKGARRPEGGDGEQASYSRARQGMRRGWHKPWAEYGARGRGFGARIWGKTSSSSRSCKQGEKESHQGGALGIWRQSPGGC